MPVDPSGVTTDDHGEGGGGGEQRPEEPIPGSGGPVADPRAGLPPIAGTGPSDGNGSNGHDEAGLPPTGGPDVTDRSGAGIGGSDPAATGTAARPQEWATAADREVGGSDPAATGTAARPQEWATAADRGVGGSEQRHGDVSPGESPSPWSTFTPVPTSPTPAATEGAPAAAPPSATTPAAAIDPEVDPNGTEPAGAGAREAGPARRLAARVRPRRAPKRKARRGLRVRQRLWSIDAWSVFKLSVLFYICVCLIVVVAGTLLWNVGRSVGTIDDVENFITRMGAYGTCTLKAEVPAGTPFEQDDDCADDEVLVGGYQFDDGTIFRVAAIGGGILVVAGSIGNVLMVVLLNLLNELTGGLRYTVVKEPIARQAAGRQRGARLPGARGVPGRSDGPRHAAKHRAPAVPSMDDDGDGDDRNEPIRVPAVEGSTDRGTQS
jgi:Transmembrane domain of unknown function (DUF3566)